MVGGGGAAQLLLISISAGSSSPSGRGVAGIAAARTLVAAPFLPSNGKEYG